MTPHLEARPPAHALNVSLTLPSFVRARCLSLAPRAERYLGESGGEAAPLAALASTTGKARQIAKDGVRAEQERGKANDRMRAEKESQAEADGKKSVRAKEASGEWEEDSSAAAAVANESDKPLSVADEQRGKDGSDEAGAAAADGDVLSTASSICTVPGAPPSPLTLVAQLSEASTEAAVSAPNSISRSGASKADGLKDEGIVLGRAPRSARVVKQGLCREGLTAGSDEGKTAACASRGGGDDKDLAAVLLQLHQGLGESTFILFQAKFLNCRMSTAQVLVRVVSMGIHSRLLLVRGEVSGSLRLLIRGLCMRTPSSCSDGNTRGARARCRRDEQWAFEGSSPWRHAKRQKGADSGRRQEPGGDGDAARR